MYEIHVKGNKIAVLLVCQNMIGYDVPGIVYEQEEADHYIVHCEIETRWDVDPFGTSEENWDGVHADLSEYTVEAIDDGTYSLCFEGVGAKTLSGILNVEIEILNKPDDSANPFCEFYRYVNGEKAEYSRFENPEFDNDLFDDMDDDISSEEFEVIFDEWHDFTF